MPEACIFPVRRSHFSILFYRPPYLFGHPNVLYLCGKMFLPEEEEKLRKAQAAGAGEHVKQTLHSPHTIPSTNTAKISLLGVPEPPELWFWVHSRPESWGLIFHIFQVISPAQLFPCQGLVKPYLASHCPFFSLQGEGKTRIALLIPVATIGSRRQYFASNFQRQIFFLKKAFLNIVSEYCCCLLASCETWRSIPFPSLVLPVLSIQHSLLEKPRKAEQRVPSPRLCLSCKESTVKC